MTAGRASADSWLSPGGGEWANGANWSTGAPPAGRYDTAVFALGSTTGYLVNSEFQSVATLLVSDDTVTVNNSGPATYGFGTPLVLNASAGKSCTLTLANSSAACNGGLLTIGGGAGTTTFNALNSNISSGGTGSYGVAVGGPAGSVTNYNQVGGVLFTKTLQIGGAGLVNVNFNGANSSTSTYDCTFSGAGGVNMTAVSSTFNGSNIANVDFGVNGGSATASMSNCTLNANYLLVGANSSATSGTSINSSGGSAALSFTNSTVDAAIGLDVGGSGGNGAVTASGPNCTVNGGLIASVGFASGTGLLSLSNGAQFYQTHNRLVMDGHRTSIGGSGGNGVVDLSGAGTFWNTSGWIINVGGDDAGSGAGLLQLDHGALLVDPVSGNQFVISAAMNLSSRGTLEILSGARVRTLSLSELPGSTLVIGLDGPAAASNGQVDLTGAAALAGTLNVVFENGYTPAVGQSFQLLTFASETGQFSTINLPPGYSADFSQLYASGVITVTAVPEPAATAAILAAAAVGGLPRRRQAVGLSGRPR